jgi:hypothetical protein
MWRSDNNTNTGIGAVLALVKPAIPTNLLNSFAISFEILVVNQISH